MFDKSKKIMGCAKSVERVEVDAGVRLGFQVGPGVLRHILLITFYVEFNVFDHACRRCGQPAELSVSRLFF